MASAVFVKTGGKTGAMTNMRQIIKLANVLSVGFFAVSALLLFLWLDLGPLWHTAPKLARIVPTSWTKTHRLPGLSAANNNWVGGTEAIAFQTGKSFIGRNYTSENLILYRIKLVPIYSKEKGPDGLPLYGLYDPDIVELVRIRLSWIIACLVLSGVLPFITVARRAHQRRQQGFPIRPFNT